MVIEDGKVTGVKIGGADTVIPFNSGLNSESVFKIIGVLYSGQTKTISYPCINPTNNCPYKNNDFHFYVKKDRYGAGGISYSGNCLTNQFPVFIDKDDGLYIIKSISYGMNWSKGHGRNAGASLNVYLYDNSSNLIANKSCNDGCGASYNRGGRSTCDFNIFDYEITSDEVYTSMSYGVNASSGGTGDADEGSMTANYDQSLSVTYLFQPK